MDRSKKLARLVKVQRQLERMAESELADVTAKREELNENLVAVVEAVGSMDPVHQRFTTLYSNQISRLTLRDAHLLALQQVQEQKVMRERAKADRLEENVREAREAEGRIAEDNQIYDLVDQSLLILSVQAQGKLETP